MRASVVETCKKKSMREKLLNKFGDEASGFLKILYPLTEIWRTDMSCC
jgi:hypothetical protein